MKRLLIYIAGVLLASLSPLSLPAQWTYHSSYINLTDAADCGTLVYGLYEGGSLLSYDRQTEEVRFLNRATGLHGTAVLYFDYCPDLHNLVLLYDDGDIDLLDTRNGQIRNMPQYMQNPDASLSLNSLWCSGSQALICTGQGLIHIDVANATVLGYYPVGASKAARIHEGSLYVQLQAGNVLRCSLKDNPLDASQWKPAGTVLPGSARDNKEALALLKANLKPYGPASNKHQKMRWTNGRLLSVAGKVDGNGKEHNPAIVMTYDGNDWRQMGTDFSADPEKMDPSRFDNPSDVIEDPADSSRLFVSYSSVGLVQYEAGRFKTRYGLTNSPLVSLVSGRNDYIRLSALAFDEQQNLWMINNGTDSLLVCRRADGTWKKYYFADLEGSTEVGYIVFDHDGRLWIADRRFAGAHRGGIFCYDRQTGKSRFRSSFTNDDGRAYTIGACYTLACDLNGQIWAGTDGGLFVVESPADYLSDDFLMLQIKVPRNDGTNYADYLLSGVAVTAITVDGANRKWIGTADNGLYFVSADGLQTIHHFTTKNSPLPSDYIYSVAIDDVSGEVYIATAAGLVSYAGDATAPLPTLDKSNLHIYPNPLRPEHPRLISIQGLTQDAEVKIATLGGQAVFRGKSLGGKLQWDACDFQGNPCASGTYLVLVTTDDGNTSVAGKLAIVR
ncbi:MAG: hypothetical protein KBS75_08650 [Bacteroidales bacterium]|nr:hypothetical protein [Candidatus Equimonas faecalis]